jgi:G3E family GTPase
MVGGFLGAGKTTAILKATEYFQAKGLRVGLITNDQSSGLVDTTMLVSHGFQTEEISGGCFCCRFNSLIEASDRLSRDIRPDLFLAEPVGSCTDLVATVAAPLCQMYGDSYSVAPLSVLVDPIRAQRILGLREGKSFSPKVLYVYEKQLEEANIIVINKSDLLTRGELTTLKRALEQRYPRVRLLSMSARSGFGVDNWLRTLTESSADTFNGMAVDYDTYADGEALLGWVNITAQVSGSEFDGNQLLLDLLANIQRRLARQEGHIPVAHLKATLAADTDLAAANLVGEESVSELSHRLSEGVERGELIINLRAEADPLLLKTICLDALRELTEDARLAVSITHQDAFRPGRPTPTHRILVG